MELRHLRYFVAVAEELNFRRAAERLNVTRPALSKQIKDLETEIGVKLLDRDTVRVALTDAGKVFLADSRAILDDVEHAVARSREAQDGRRGQIRIGSVGQIAASFLPDALRAFRVNFPDVEVTFVEMTPPEQLEALAKDEIDLGFAYGRDTEKVPGMSSLLLVRSTFGVSMSKDHPFATRRALRLEELHDQSMLCVGDEKASTHRRDILSMFEEAGTAPASVRQILGFESLLTMIAADQGLSMLPEVLDLRSSHGIVTVPLLADRARADFTMWAVWKTAGASLLVRNFVRLLERNRPADSMAVA
ncbi:LysR substrate-binding domain-containing protein [Luteolibacter sp. Populi]|uniref:LysR substrate-binding domain-containing protein n=1 Tax=Luteolibacter sp. Populi TaxID=3230487 RepID=UPI003467CBBB